MSKQWWCIPTILIFSAALLHAGPSALPKQCLDWEKVPLFAVAQISLTFSHLFPSAGIKVIDFLKKKKKQ